MPRNASRRAGITKWPVADPYASKREYSLPGGIKLNGDDLVRYSWETGIGLPKLKLNKLEMEIFHRQIALPGHGRLFELLARRSGKTWGLLVLIEFIARTMKGAVIRYAAPSKTQAKEIVIPNWQLIQDDCPKELRCVDRVQQDGCYIWPTTGSRLYLAGTDDTDQIDRLRGPFAHLLVVDEVGFHHCDLRRLILGVLAPQLATTRGKLIMCTTPPESMDHGCVEFIKTARERGYLIEKTIWDNDMLDDKSRRQICKEANPQASDDEIELIYAGKMKGSPEWEREWLCRLVTDDNLRVVREFDEKQHVADLPRPQYFTPYTFIDLAFSRDNCAAIMCYFDFTNSRLVVEDEWLGKAKVLSEVKAAVEAKELALWGPDVRVTRYGDGSALGAALLATLTADFGMEVLPCTMGSNKEVMINALREFMGAKRVMIHPRCVNLIAQLRDGIWKPSFAGGTKLDYQRSETLGHLDALDALVYGVRSVDWHLNPTPPGKLNQHEWCIPTVSHKELSDQQRAVLSMFRRVIGRQ